MYFVFQENILNITNSPFHPQLIYLLDISSRAVITATRAILQNESIHTANYAPLPENTTYKWNLLKQRTMVYNVILP